jgi:hypothetical protein
LIALLALWTPAVNLLGYTVLVPMSDYALPLAISDFAIMPYSTESTLTNAQWHRANRA